MSNSKRREEPVSFIHDTEDGQVHLWASSDDEGGWNARFWGRELAGARHFDTVAKANAYLRDSFTEMFPEHRCTEQCGTATEIAQRRGMTESGYHDYSGEH